MRYTAWRPLKASAVVLALVLCGALSPARGLADIIDAGAGAASGNWYYKSDEGSSSVWFGTLSWATKASINWAVSKFTADGAAQPTAPVPFSEIKFTPTTPLPTAKVFTGYNIAGTGTSGSTVISTGAGSSNVGVAFYGANWNVTASGGGTYGVRADANDPWPLFASDFTSFTSGSKYSLYIPFSMTSGQLDKTKLDSGYGFDVSYTTAAGMVDLLNVQVSNTGVTVTPNLSLGSQLSFYQEANSTTSPYGMSTTPGTLLTTSQLTSLIMNDVASDGTLISPINLAIQVDGLAIPTGLLSDGSVASIAEDLMVFEDAVSATVSEPSTLALLGAGLVGLGFFRRRNLNTPRISTRQGRTSAVRGRIVAPTHSYRSLRLVRV
jgi:PEP-CTERM motif-containing protein